MYPERTLRRLLILWPAALIAVAGCGNESDRVAEVAVEATKRQAALDQEMTRLNREVADGTRRLVEAQAAADQQLLAQQQHLQSQHDALESERREIAGQRQRESLLSPVLLTVGSLLVCSLPLVLCWYLLHDLGPESADTQLTQILVDELADQERGELPLGQDPCPRLPTGTGGVSVPRLENTDP